MICSLKIRLVMYLMRSQKLLLTFTSCVMFCGTVHAQTSIHDDCISQHSRVFGLAVDKAAVSQCIDHKIEVARQSLDGAYAQQISDQRLSDRDFRDEYIDWSNVQRAALSTMTGTNTLYQSLTILDQTQNPSVTDTEVKLPAVDGYKTIEGR